jgi:hypothetical protein
MLVASMVTSWALVNKSGIVLWLFVILMLPDRHGLLRDDQHDDRDPRVQAVTQCARSGAAITAIGMSFILQNIGLVWKGRRPTSVPDILPHGTVFTIGGVPYTWNKFIVLLFTIPVLWPSCGSCSGHGTGRRCGDRPGSRGCRDDGDQRQPHDLLHVLPRGCMAGAAALLYALYFTNIRYTKGSASA